MEDDNKRTRLILTQDQQRVFDQLVDFIRSKTQRVFILCGYAGTGKTTMMKALIEELKKRNERFSLHASTGRAAKILTNITGVNATTVHSLIYKFSDFNKELEKFEKDIKKEKDGQLLLKFELVAPDMCECIDWFYIIDEASMISDKEDKTPSQAIFGSGRLLHDLLNYNSRGKFIFIGDTAQLPPVKSDFSPALSVEYFREVFHIDAVSTTLTQIVRQKETNDLPKSASMVRQLLQAPPNVKWGKFPLRNYNNIIIKQNTVDLLNAYIGDIKSNGYEMSTMIARSNRQCSIYTQNIRPALGFCNPDLSVGDLLMITQNNLLSGLMNGDMVRVTQINNRIRRAGLTFLYVEVEELFTRRRYSQFLIEEIVYGSQVNLTQDQQQQLFIDFYYRMRDKGIKQNSKCFKEEMIRDVYLNALRAVFGYVLTCHKAQGGEWENVYLDIPRNLAHTPDSSAYRWLYTAMTRASLNLHISDDFYVL